MKSKSPFLRKSPLKIVDYGDTFGGKAPWEVNQPEPTYTPRPQPTGYDQAGPNQYDYLLPKTSQNTTNAFIGETESQQRTSEQMRASNEARLAAGGTRGTASDAGYSSQVNAVTGLSPDAFAGDEILPASEGMGQVIVSGGTPNDNALIESGEAMGPVTTTSSGERVGTVGAQSGMTGYLDESGNAIQTSELADDMQDDSWINDTGAVTMPGETPTTTQTTQVESGGTPSPAVDNANIPESMGGTDLNAGSNSQPGCNNNYMGDGALYDPIR